MQVATYGKLEELYECCTSCLGEFTALKTFFFFEETRPYILEHSLLPPTYLHIKIHITLLKL